MILNFENAHNFAYCAVSTYSNIFQVFIYLLIDIAHACFIVMLYSNKNVLCSALGVTLRSHNGKGKEGGSSSGS